MEVSSRIPFLLQGLRAPTDTYRERDGIIQYVECLQMIKPMVVGFCSIGVCCYSEFWTWDFS